MDSNLNITKTSSEKNHSRKGRWKWRPAPSKERRREIILEAQALNLTAIEARKRYQIGYLIYKKACAENNINLRSSRTRADVGSIKQIMWDAYEKGWSAKYAARIHKVKASSLYAAAYKNDVCLPTHNEFLQKNDIWADKQS